MRIWSALAADATCIAIFALVGRSSHDKPTDLLGVLATAWPFLAGYLVGLVLTRGWRDPLGPRTSIPLWATTVALGMVFRTVSGAEVQLSFVVVTTVVLATLLLGWRGLHRLVLRARTRNGHGAVT